MANSSESGDNLPLYKNKAFHINTSRKYEIIGSSQDESHENTVCIKKANLEPMHAEIKLKEAYVYYITPRAYAENDDYEGTVRVGTYIRVPEEGMDLYSLKDDKMVKFGDTLAGLVKSDVLFADVETWIKSNGLEEIKPYIQRLNIKVLKDLKLHTETIINAAFSDKAIKGFEEAKKIRMIFNEIDPSQSGRKKK